MPRPIAGARAARAARFGLTACVAYNLLSACAWSVGITGGGEKASSAEARTAWGSSGRPLDRSGLSAVSPSELEAARLLRRVTAWQCGRLPPPARGSPRRASENFGADEVARTSNQCCPRSGASTSVYGRMQFRARRFCFGRGQGVVKKEGSCLVRLLAARREVVAHFGEPGVWPVNPRRDHGDANSPYADHISISCSARRR